MPTKFTIRRVGAISLANISGLMYALLGLVGGVFVALFSMFGAAVANATGRAGNPFGAAFGMAAIFVLPILYGILGWIIGAITAGLYNLLAGMIGGVQVECDQHGPAAGAIGSTM